MNKHTARLLEKHFDTPFAAPDGIARLRELILTLAMQGKLVEQDTNDQPASELLKEIEAEKQRLIQGEKIKKPKPLSPVKPEEVPYELPQGWEWVRLGEIGFINPRNEAEDTINAGFVPMPLIPEGYSENHQFEERLWKEIKKGYTHFADGDIGMAKITPCFENAKSCVFSGLPNGIGAGTTELHIFRNSFNSVAPRFLLYYLKNPHYISAAVPNMTGSAGQKRVPTAYFIGQLLPLPPKDEQHRIVAKIDQLMARCDELEKLRTEQQQKRLAIHTAAIRQLLDTENHHNHQKAWQFLNQHFDDLYTVKENVTELRKAILKLAVMGKLAPHNPNDPPASELLEEISKKRTQILEKFYPNESESKTQLNKQKKQVLPKSLPTLPIGWAWATLMQCSLIIVDCHNKTAPYSDSGIVLLRTSNIRNGCILLDEVKYVTEKTFERWAARATPEAGDILITREAPMGEVCIIPKEPKVCMGQRMMLIRVVPQTINNQFLLYSLRDPNIMNRVQDKPVGMTVQHLRVGGVETLLVPLPPLSEQNRIVAKIEQLMALCDTLETQIDSATSKQTELLNALIHAQSQGDTKEESQPASLSKSQVIDLATYRAAIGCYAVNNLANAQYFGRTAAAKVLYLAQAHIGLKLGLQPERKAAGPLDPWIYDFERQGQDKGWFEVNKKTLKSGRKKTEYRCLSALSEPSTRAEALMSSEQKVEFDRLIYALTDKTTEQVEIIATLFAVWNDFLIDSIQPTDEQIIADMRENWHERKARFSPSDLKPWLSWLRRENFTPRGLSPRTVQQQQLGI
ncbi:restriction endonuclease subunit S [Kineobactrum salinum]|uniref:Restriction endonuclease subunit S n=1 Tax=Kineobactrum salinum TaxID=2708301 RepID=A0A6C0U1D9_9GAMM|nr:restriction endonuclease subunit S [Kineobactrum salinum]QIB65603.1 restriction endonuclease subunit S [Kineobactrum salinum]